MTTLFDDADWEEKYPQLRDLLVSDPKFAVLFQDFLDGTLELEYMPQVNVLVSTTVRDSHWGTGPYSHISIYGSMFGRNIFHARRSMDIVQGVVYHELFSVKGPFQGLGVGQSLHDSMLELYRRNGMKRIELEANIDVGGYTWARFGFDWTERYSEISSFYVSDDDEDLEDIGYGEMRLDDLRYTIGELLSQVRGKLSSYRIVAQQGYIQHWEQQIDEMAGRLDGDESNWPTPAEIAALGYIPGSKSRLWPGKAVMLNSTWNGVYFL
jgi:GNAT superfamily N-acetyltransferase